MPERGSWSIVAEGSWSSEISEGPDKGEGGGREVIEALMLGGVDIGLEGGEVERRMLVRREAKKAVGEDVVSLWVVSCGLRCALVL